MSQALKRNYRVEEDISHTQNAPGWSHSSQDATESCIIQCPSCQTRFSLPLTALVGQADPRFHCSQCDTIFQVEDDAEATAGHSPEEPYESVSSFDPGAYNTEPPYEDIVPGSAIEELMNASAVDTIQPEIIRVEEPPLPTPTPVQSRSFEIPKSISTDWSFGPPHESAPVEPPPPLGKPVASDFVQPSQIDLQLEKPSMPQDELSFGRPARNESRQSAPRPSGNEATGGPKGPKKSKAPTRAKKGEVSIQKRQLLLESAKRLRISLPLGRWQAPLVVAGPLLVFCAALLCLSVFLRTNPLQSEELITSVVPGLPRVAPPGLAVIEARLRRLTLDSGDTIYALSGSVKNNSGRQLNQIHLDGLVFDKTGSMITEKKVLVSSPLAQSKIKSLSLEMIEDIEANASRGKTAVKDGESAPFVVTFLPNEVAGARYFSTRIHSIK